MFRFARITAAAAAAFLSLSAAQAGVVYDTSLDSPPGVFFGTGNPNTNWTVDNESGGVQLGLLGLQRYVGAYDPGAGSNIYHAATGQNLTHGGSVWDIAFSINSGDTSLNNVIASLCMTDVGTGSSGCMNPLGIGDNAIRGNVAQNSEPLAFGNASPDLFALVLNDAAYNVNANDTYDFTLSLMAVTGAPMGQVSATVVTGTGANVPEPPTLALFGTLLLGLGWFGLRRRVAAKA